MAFRRIFHPFPLKLKANGGLDNRLLNDRIEVSEET
jgi:hypothetical protein